MSTPGLAPPPVEVRRPPPTPAAPVRRRKPAISSPRPRAGFEGWPTLLSLGSHAIALVALIFLLRLGPPRSTDQPPTAPRETVDYVDLQWPTTTIGAVGGGETASSTDPPPVPSATLPRRPGDAAPLVFPGGVPRGLPAPAGSGAVGAGESGAPAAGGGAGGVGERLRPGFSDPRLYVGPEGLPRAEKSNHQKYMEHLNARIQASNDSVYAATPRPDTDWTFRDANGKRWGVSEKGLHLGGLTVPKELIPRPRPTGTNAELEKARDEQRQRDEIRRQEEDRERRKAREESAKAARERRGGGED